MHCLARTSPQATSAARGSLKSCSQDLFLPGRGHVAMPKREFILQMPNPGVYSRGQSLVRKLWLLGCLLHQPPPGQQLRHPSQMLMPVFFCSSVCQVLALPGTQRGTNLIPILYRCTEVTQHARLKISQLANLEGQRSRRRLHALTLPAHGLLINLQPAASL